MWRAAELVWRASGRRGQPHGFAIDLKKRIPMQAGLGGGSSDAAAAARAVGALLGVPDARQREIAARLGADVPFFFDGGTALGLERGDVLFPLVERPATWVVLVLPGFGVSTKEAYGWWDRDARRPHSRRRAPANDLQPVVVRRHPEIARLSRALARAGAAEAALSGSGSAVFGVFRERAGAERAARKLGRMAPRVIVSRTVGRAAYRRLARLVASTTCRD